MAENQKAGVAEMTRQLIPHVGRIVETLPLFLAMTNDQTAVKKLLTFVRSWLSPAIVFTETDSLSLFRRRRRFSTIKSE